MAKKKTRKKKAPAYSYAYPGLQMPNQDPYAYMDPYTKSALGIAPMEGEVPESSNPLNTRKSPTPGKGGGGAGAMAAQMGRAAGQAISGVVSGGVGLLNALIPEQQEYKRPSPLFNYDPDQYGRGLNTGALYDNGGDIVSPIKTGQLQVEDNQFSFLSPETINLGGQYHQNGGTNLQYGGNIVEAEKNEPVSIGEDGNAIVWGNLEVPGTNMKFKTAAKRLAKEEKKNSDLLGKATRLIQKSNPFNAYEALSFNTGDVLNEAAKLRSDKVAAQKDALSNMQQSLLDYAEATGQKPERVAKKFKKGGKLFEYTKGGSLPCMDCGGEFEDGGMIAGMDFNIAAYPNFLPDEEAKSGFKLNPDHKGWCTPMSKPTCTGKRRQFAINAKNHFKKQDEGGVITKVRKEGGMKVTEEIPLSMLQQPLPQPVAPPVVQPQPIQKVPRRISYEKLQDQEGRILYSPKFQGEWTEHQRKQAWNSIPDMFGGHSVLKGQAWQDVQQMPGWTYSNTSGSRNLPNVARPEFRPNNYRPSPTFAKLMNGGQIDVGQEVELTDEEFLYLKNMGYDLSE